MPPRQPTRSLRIDALRRGDPTDRRTKDGKARADRYDFMEKTRKLFEEWSDADQDQRERELDDIRFYNGDQWPEDVKLARAGQNASGGLPPIPARPCIVINQVREPVNQVLNQERDADLGIELTPADDFEGLGVQLDSTEIELREGLIRRIQRESQAANARSWAFQRALIAGRGFYGVMVRYGQGKTFDQELCIEEFFNQACVTPDPNHQQPDGSDQKGAFVGNWIPWDNYKDRYPSSAKKKNPISDLNDSDFIAFGNEAPKWFKTEKDQRHVYVVDYYQTVTESRELCQLKDGSVVWRNEFTGDKLDILDTRDVLEQKVKWYKLDGASPEPLEETDWLGPDIPIIKVVGEELQPVDNERACEGMVRPARGANEGFNSMASKLVEMVAMTPMSNTYTAVGQTEGLEKFWNLSTTRTLPTVPYNTSDSEGNRVGPPTVINKETPIQPVSFALHMFSEAVQTTTRRHDPSLGKVDPALKSGRAIKQVIDQSKEGTSNYLDNLRRSIRYEAQILNNLLYPVYGTRPGRLAKIVNGEGKPQTIMLGQPSIMQGSRPVPANGASNGVKNYTLSENANCNVSIKITRSFETRRQEETAIIGDILSADPNLMTVIGDLFFEHQDGPGHKEIAERMKVMLAPPVQKLLASQAQGQPFDLVAQQQIAMAHQVIEKAQQEIQGLQQQLQTKQVEQQGKMAVTQAQETAETQRNRENNETKLAVAELSAKMERIALFLEERARLGAHITDVNQSANDRAHEVGTMALDHAMTLEQNDQTHQQALQQGQQAAALAPSPQADGA